MSAWTFKKDNFQLYCYFLIFLKKDTHNSFHDYKRQYYFSPLLQYIKPMDSIRQKLDFP